MIGYTTLGTNDLDRATAFYDPVLALLDQHRDGTGNFTRELRALVGLEIWSKAC